MATRRKHIKMTEARKQAQKRYDEQTKDRNYRVCLKFNNKKDNEVAKKLKREKNKQGYIKKLIEEDIVRENTPVYNLNHVRELVSADEIALALSEEVGYDKCKYCGKDKEMCEEDCFFSIKEWLLTEVDDEEESGK